MTEQYRESFFTLSISYDEFYRVYAGSAKYVVTRAFDGRRIRFDANHLRPFLTHSGIHGLFVIRYDKSNKFKSIEKIES